MKINKNILIDNKSFDAVILAGGKGTRIKKFLKDKPKPLAKIGGYYFLDLLLNNIAKFNLNKIYILAGYKGSHIYKRYHNKMINFVPIECLVERKPLGTGGAISLLKNKISKNFFLFNGDTIFDFNFFEMLKLKKKGKHVMALFRSNYQMEGNNIRNLKVNRHSQVNKAKVFKKKVYSNGGIYLFDKSIFKNLSKRKISLENDILDNFISKNKVFGLIKNDFFYDIGTKKDFLKSKKVLLNYFRKPGVFFDRDNTINEDKGYTFRFENFKFINNSLNALKYLSKKNYYIFIVTNQAGIAKNKFTENDFLTLHRKLKKFLLSNNIFIHDIKYCPFHPKGTVSKYRKNSKYRKPGNLMIKEIFKKWVVYKKKSFMIGDKISDKMCSKNSLLKFQFVKKDLKKQLQTLI
ncbi:HAD-IIIA family hydrolase [Candidatus Pelagibacter sp.]|nr:HAD-IIIA family hydrolase [Candidatus Pelagibacter sp.]